ncbi:MAG TPA: conjugal transfer protein TrbI [Nostocaceae cyanobacterium]|nr:conjugal transfer protein TrbI [Nostocaceae cyanobacterium]
MSKILRWKSGTAAFMALAITTCAATPFITFAPAQAQYRLNQSRTVTIPSNVTFPVTYEKEKVIVSPGETIPLTLQIADDIVDSRRNVLIPVNTEIVGELRPVNVSTRVNSTGKGVRFVAKEIVFPSGQRQTINATSQTITKTEKISKGTDTGQILTDAAIGAGAASVISLITGNKKIELLEVLGGGAAGALASVLLRKNQAEVYVLRPEQDLDITLTSGLTIARN